MKQEERVLREGREGLRVTEASDINWSNGESKHKREGREKREQPTQY